MATWAIYPHRCWSCLVPCLIREDFCCDEVDGQLYTYCSEGCRWTHKVAFAAEYEGRPTPAMGRFSGRREWEDCYHGWDVADAIKDLGFVRNDGKTLVPQPHLRFDAKDMWTLDDVRARSREPIARVPRFESRAGRAAIAEYRKGFKINPATSPDQPIGPRVRPLPKSWQPESVATVVVCSTPGTRVGRLLHKVRLEPVGLRWISKRETVSTRRFAKARPDARVQGG